MHVKCGKGGSEQRKLAASREAAAAAAAAAARAQRRRLRSSEFVEKAAIACWLFDWKRFRTFVPTKGTFVPNHELKRVISGAGGSGGTGVGAVVIKRSGAKPASASAACAAGSGRQCRDAVQDRHECMGRQEGKKGASSGKRWQAVARGGKRW